MELPHKDIAKKIIAEIDFQTKLNERIRKLDIEITKYENLGLMDKNKEEFLKLNKEFFNLYNKIIWSEKRESVYTDQYLGLTKIPFQLN